MKALFIILLTLSCAQAQKRFEVTWSRLYSGTSFDNYGFITASYFNLSRKLKGFMEYGITAMPKSKSTTDTYAYRPDEKQSSFFGFYTGYSPIIGSGLLRPGFTLGTLLWNEVHKPQWDQSSNTYRYSRDYDPGLYWAVKLQAHILTLSFSSVGYGGGINIRI